MNSIPPDHFIPTDLAQIMERGDIWRGHSRPFVPQVALDSGYPALNAGLLAQGWPLSSLIEICQPNLSNCEWLLLTPALLKTSGGYIVLLNPPAMPFCQALIQLGIDLERVLIVRTNSKADFLFSFFELTRAEACDAVLAWQPQQAFSYTELRKCLLATADGAGLYVLFRSANMQQQNSPAALRIFAELTSAELQVTIFKQKGMLQVSQARPIALPLPKLWQGLPSHRLLNENLFQENSQGIKSSTNNSKRSNNVKSKSGTVTPLRSGKL